MESCWLYFKIVLFVMNLNEKKVQGSLKFHTIVLFLVTNLIFCFEAIVMYFQIKLVITMLMMLQIKIFWLGENMYNYTHNKITKILRLNGKIQYKFMDLWYLLYCA